MHISETDLKSKEGPPSQQDKLLTLHLTHIQASITDGEPRDLLDALLMGQNDSGRGQKSCGSEDERITDDHVLMTAAEAFGAGVETTSTTLLWILAYLLHHPEVNYWLNFYYHYC